MEVPFEKGLLGHSDADVLAHAVMDAVLGAAALGDIGKHFPDTDPAYAGADSLQLAQHVARIMREQMCIRDSCWGRAPPSVPGRPGSRSG